MRKLILIYYYFVLDQTNIIYLYTIYIFPGLDLHFNLYVINCQTYVIFGEHVSMNSHANNEMKKCFKLLNLGERSRFVNVMGPTL